MAKIGEKRSAEDEAEGCKLATPTASSGGFALLFKPSPLANVASNLTTYTKGTSPDPTSSSLQKSPSSRGLQKFTFSEVNQTVKSPVKFTTPSIMRAQTPRSIDNGTGLLTKRPHSSTSNDDVGPSTTKKSNLFMECLSHSTERSSSTSGSSSSSSSSSSSESQQPQATATSKDSFVFGSQLSSRAVMSKSESSTKTIASDDDSIIKDTPTASSSSIGGVSHPSVSLPTVETVTGEEGERHVTQVSCSLFVFESASRSWKERGRGELRLNDTPKSEGAYQSRLIMRTSGSRRVCLNTHLWAAMVCEKLNSRSIRITAQEPEGGFGVYLIKGAPKDIGNLFAAVKRRLDALKIASTREKGQSATDPVQVPPPTSNPGFDEDDSICGDRPQSYSSSPDWSPERVPERLEQPHPSSSPPAYSTSSPSSHYPPPSSLTTTVTTPPAPPHSQATDGGTFKEDTSPVPSETARTE